MGCFGLSLRFFLQGGLPLAPVLLAAMGLGVLVSGAVVLVKASHSDEDDAAHAAARSRSSSRSLVPLAGILMNMLMLSGLPLQALISVLLVDALCLPIYFRYAAP